MEISLSLLEELTKTVKAVGCDNTINALKVVRTNYGNSNSISYIMEMVAAEMNLPVEHFINRDKSDERKAALMLCTHFLYVNYKIPFRDLSVHLKRKKSSLSQYLLELNQAINKKNNPSPFEKMLQGRYRRIEALIKLNQEQH